MKKFLTRVLIVIVVFVLGFLFIPSDWLNNHQGKVVGAEMSDKVSLKNKVDCESEYIGYWKKVDLVMSLPLDTILFGFSGDVTDEKLMSSMGYDLLNYYDIRSFDCHDILTVSSIPHIVGVNLKELRKVIKKDHSLREKILSEEKKIIKELKIKDGMSKKEAVFLIGKYLSQRIEYEEESVSWSLADCIENRKAVCWGYSYLFYDLCSLCDISVQKVIGVANDNSSNSNHMWNNVKINKKVFLCDITWYRDSPDNKYFMKEICSSTDRESHHVISVID